MGHALRSIQRSRGAATVTSVMHPTPPFRTVAAEQLRAVGVVLRREAIVFLSLLGIISVTVIAFAARYPHDVSATLGPVDGFFGALIGAVVPFAVWRSESPSRRSYHWAMPIARGPHALLKMLAGWLWLMAAIAILALFAAVCGIAVDAITRAPWHMGLILAWYWWVLPFTAATLVYVALSILLIGSDHPWRWLAGGGGVGFVFLSASAILSRPEFRTWLWRVVMSSRYGMSGALFGSFYPLDASAWPGDLHLYVGTAQWVETMLLWAGVCVFGLFFVVYRRER